MKAIVFLYSSLVVSVLSAAEVAPPDKANSWSKPINGLQARITLVEKPKNYGVRWLVPYLELRYVGDIANPLKVRCGEQHVKFELITADGKVVRGGQSLHRSGPHADPGTIVLPFDSSIRISMACVNWGIPKNATAMVSTDSSAWILGPKEKAKVYLRAMIAGEKMKSDRRLWHGSIETPPIKIDWGK